MSGRAVPRRLRSGAIAVSIARSMPHGKDSEYAIMVKADDLVPEGTWGRVVQETDRTVVFRGRNTDWDGPHWVQASKTEVEVV